MEDLRLQAQSALLDDSGLGPEDLRQAAGEAVSAGEGLADLYLERTLHESLELDEGRISRGSHSGIVGMSLRAACGEATAFASVDMIDKGNLKRLATVVKNGKRHLSGGDNSIHITGKEPSAVPRYGSDSPVALPDKARKRIMRQIDERARSSDNRVMNVISALSLAHKAVMVTRSDGVSFADIRPMYGLRVSVIVSEDGKTEVGDSGIGGRSNPEGISESDIDDLVDEAVRVALMKLTASPTPAGMMPVVLGNGWAGILLHEAVGHGLEGDFNRKGQSAFSGRIGERVATKGVTVVDDGTLFGRRGSLTCDDEGVPSACNTLIEDGVLKNYMQDLVNSSLMGLEPTGNGRRESFRHEPMPRMTNTYMLKGERTPEEIIASVKRGLYCKSFGGGSVDITNGNFNFDVKEAYLIVDGKLGQHVKGATLIGNGPDSMTKMSMVGDDLQLDPGVGTCGKNGQWVPVGVGQPHCKVDEMLVGGTEV